jgi:hypothetical protein
MASSKHKDRGKTVKEFCATAGTPCKCPQGNNYRTVCKPRWVTHTFPRVINKKPKKIVIQLGYEAHHILCISSVTTNVIGAKGIKPILEVTKWCINAKRNMVPLPLWGHYVRWYCKITAEEYVLKKRVPAPPFSNWPAHDFDHNCNNGYTQEADKECESIADAAKDAAKEHDISEADLKAALDSASSDFRGRLRTRGKRGGGTHASWRSGIGSTGNDWCKAFSMADNAFVNGKSFPMREFDAQTEKLMKAIQKAVKAGG